MTKSLFLVTSLLSCGSGNVDCRAECETWSDPVLEIVNQDGGGISEELFKEGCQELSAEASCEDCLYEISEYLIEVFSLTPDCACYFEESRDEVSWDTTPFEAEPCDAVRELYGGWENMAADCSTCSTA